MRLLLTPGQASDKTAVPPLLDGLPVAQAAVADRGYDSDAVLALVRQRAVDPAIYRQRSLVERFFCKLKQFRRVATRFDKLARNFLAAVLLASARIWLRAVKSTP